MVANHWSGQLAGTSRRLVIKVVAIAVVILPSALLAQIVEEVTIEGGIPPTRTGGRHVKIEFEAPQVCFSMLVGKRREVALRDCFPVCESKGRRVYIDHQGESYELGHLDDRGILIVDPTKLVPENHSAPVQFSLLQEGKKIRIDISNAGGSAGTPFTDLAISSEVDLQGCKLSTEQWGIGEMSAEDTFKLIQARRRSLETDPRTFQKIWRELEKRHGKKYRTR